MKRQQQQQQQQEAGGNKKNFVFDGDDQKEEKWQRANQTIYSHITKPDYIIGDERYFTVGTRFFQNRPIARGDPIPPPSNKIASCLEPVSIARAYELVYEEQREKQKEKK